MLNNLLAVILGLSESVRDMVGGTPGLADDLDELVDILEPWGATIRDAGGYLPSGPHELAAQRN